MSANPSDPVNRPGPSWLLRMAWRDSRRNRARLFLFVASNLLGIAALVAMYGFGVNLRRAIDREARAIAGADLIADGNRPPDTVTQELLTGIGGEQASERSFASMLYFTRSGGTRLVQVRAIDGGYPFYGEIETIPAEAAARYQEGRMALVDQTLMIQFDARVGDTIRLGESLFQIAGIVRKSPGRTGFSTTIAPGVFIPLRYLPETGLEQKGSRIRYLFYFRLPPTADPQAIADRFRDQLDLAGMDIATVESTKRDAGRAFEDFSRFLNLISFIALLLGCLGVASAVYIYVREKRRSIAVLRCLGVTGRQAFLIYLFQIAGIGALGALLGSLLGTVIQFLLPRVFRDFLPVDVEVGVSWAAILLGVCVGLLISVMFALFPLIRIRSVSPLDTLRVSDRQGKTRPDPLQLLVGLILTAFVLVFIRIQTGSLSEAAWFTAGVILAFLLLAGTALLLIRLARFLIRDSWSYITRQGFANLFRPQNQTLVLIVAIGMGSFFIATLYTMQGLLVERVAMTGRANQPNMILFDIQDGQKEQVAELTRDFGLPVLQEVPIVNMRIESINGVHASAARTDSSSRHPARAFEGELRVTYRDSLTDSETLVGGRFSGEALPGLLPAISLEEAYARRLRVDLGDTIVFNVQGALVPTVVGSLRKVDWNRVQTNFRVVFPVGVLEEAPKFHVLVTRVPQGAISARYQQRMVASFPTISIIDLDLILRVMEDVLSQIAFVIRFMGGFGVATGLIVLLGAILLSRFQRIQEAVLLRTVGASRGQVLRIAALEYFFLGSLAAMTGILLSVAGSWALAEFSFDMPYSVDWTPLVLIFTGVTALTILIGLANSREALRRPPLEVLRKEG